MAHCFKKDKEVNMPKVSVIVPVFGVESCIERSAKSLFSQTLEDVEFIFIDDCSPDKSINILNSVLKRYPNRNSQVVIHRMSSNSGQALVREWGIKHASGDYIIHCDSDDWVDTKMLEKMYDLAVRENADMVVCDFIRTDGKEFSKYVKGCHTLQTRYFIEDCIYQKSTWALWNKLVKRTCYSAITSFPTESMGEDMSICLQIMTSVSRISYIEEPLYYYYYNPNSISRKNSITDIERKHAMLGANMKTVEALVENDSIKVGDKALAVSFLRFINALIYLPLYHSDNYKRKILEVVDTIPLLPFIFNTRISLYSKHLFLKLKFKSIFG